MDIANAIRISTIVGMGLLKCVELISINKTPSPNNNPFLKKKDDSQTNPTVNTINTIGNMMTLLPGVLSSIGCNNYGFNNGFNQNDYCQYFNNPMMNPMLMQTIAMQQAQMQQMNPNQPVDPTSRRYQAPPVWTNVNQYINNPNAGNMNYFSTPYCMPNMSQPNMNMASQQNPYSSNPTGSPYHAQEPTLGDMVDPRRMQAFMAYMHRTQQQQNDLPPMYRSSNNNNSNPNYGYYDPNYGQLPNQYQNYNQRPYTGGQGNPFDLSNNPEFLKSRAMVDRGLEDLRNFLNPNRRASQYPQYNPKDYESRDMFNYSNRNNNNPNATPSVLDGTMPGWSVDPWQQFGADQAKINSLKQQEVMDAYRASGF